MKTTWTGGLALAALLALPGLASAQGRPAPTQDELKAKYTAKLALPFLKKAEWLTDYDKALATAKQSGKFIFAYFSRSYSP